MEKVLSDYEKNGGTYHWEGDYLIPDLILPPETDDRPIGIWGAGVLRTPLPKAEAPTEPAGETEGTEIILLKTKKLCILLCGQGTRFILTSPILTSKRRICFFGS